jgi:hypothetical protein
VRKATTTPRIPKLYTLLMTVIKISSKYQYFEKPIEQFGVEDPQEAQTERQNTFNMLLTFLKELIGKSEEF